MAFELAGCVICLIINTQVLVYTADINYLRTTITNHFSDTRHHVANAPYKKQAREFIFNEFTRFGLNPEYHKFAKFDDPLAANVVGVLKGSNFGTNKDHIIGIGAHYDTVAITKGVDDNGAGVAAMLEVAKQLTSMDLQGHKRKNTIFFVSFDHEENGYVGSREFIPMWLYPWLTSNYGNDWNVTMAQAYGAVILDTMMEYNTSKHSQIIPGNPAAFQQIFPQADASIKSDSNEGDFLALIYRHHEYDSFLARNLSTAWHVAGSPQFQIEPFPLPTLNDVTKSLLGDFLRSDHRNFWDNGIPAIFLSDSANLRGDMIKCYHHECDNLEVMLTDDNLQFLGKTVDAITTTLHNLSGPDDVSIVG